MAKASDQLKQSDVTFWGVFALATWAIAIIGANLSALIPDGVLGGLHASRLDGATLNQLRGQVVALNSEAVRLKQENTVLVQRFMLNEANSTDMSRRVGALEITVPRILESLNANPGIDRTTVTASTGATTSFDAPGGSVSYTTSPLPNGATKPTSQPMPQALATEVQPDPSSFGIALGPPIDATEANATWQSLNDRVGTLLLGLGPLLGHVEGGSGRRVVAGPITSESDARDLCGRMAKVGIACQSVPFIGDPLQ